MALKEKWQKTPTVCPQCKTSLVRILSVLRAHFRDVHGRPPTRGEETQFKIFRKTETPYSDNDFIKPRNEVSGGGFSPK